MDSRRFDSLARSLATPKTRRGLLGGIAALGAGLLGARAAEGQVSQAQCGNVTCKNNPGKCNAGCVCCVWGNGNSRCMPPGGCSGTVTCPPGQVVDPASGCVTTTTTTTAAPTTTTTTTTTAAPTTTTTTTAAPLPLRSACAASPQCASGHCCPAGDPAEGLCGIPDCTPIPVCDFDTVSDCCSLCCFTFQPGDPGFCCAFDGGITSNDCPEAAQLTARSGSPIVIYADGRQAP